jgi:hypothetical protein
MMTGNRVPVWNVHFMMYLKMKPTGTAYLGTGSLVSQTPWKTETRTNILACFVLIPDCKQVM